MHYGDRLIQLGRFSLLSSLAMTTVLLPANAQITPDNTLGPGNNPVLVINGTRIEIGGGLRLNSALFQSFDQFNVNTNQQVYFLNPAGVQNIFSRVTGGSLSTIDGLLGVAGSANLFIMNPNGILFGPNARLDVSGSFLATTATALDFPDGQRFAATGAREVPLVEVNIPTGLQMGLTPPAMLNNQGNLTVGPGQSLTLAGGNTVNTGSLMAAGGTVQVLGNQVALLDQTRIDVSSPTGGGTVLVGGGYQGQGALLNSQSTVVGPDVLINANAQLSGDGGTVVIWSDGNTSFSGTITAQGGPQGGNGGLVEVSGKQNLGFQGQVDASATQGQAGTLLLDPSTVIIAAAGSAPVPPVGAGSFTISATNLQNALTAGSSGTNVILQADNSIDVDAAVTWNQGNLYLFAGTSSAGGTINLRASLTPTNSAGLFGGNGSGSNFNSTVNINGTDSIQTGVDIAANNATLNVTAGTYNQDVTIAKPLTLNFTGNVTLGGDLNVNSAINLSGNLSTTGNNHSLSFQAVNLNGATSLTSSNSGGGVTFNNTVSGSANLEINAGANAITFQNTVGSSATPLGTLTLNSTGTTQFASTVNAASVATNLGGATRIGGNVTTTGAQTYSGNVEITNTPIILSSGSNGIIFSGDVTGNPAGSNLTVNAGAGAITFTGAVSSIGSLATNSTGLTTFASTVNTGSVATNNALGTTRIGSNITTVGTQIYSGNVEITNTPITLSSSDNDIIFGGTVTGNPAGSNLTVDSGLGNITFTGAVSSIGSLAVNSAGLTTFVSTVNTGSVATNAGGTTRIGGNVTTTGGQAYDDNVEITNTPITLSSTNNGDITFGGTVTGNPPGSNLTVSSGSGDITFTGAVSSIGNLAANSTDLTTFGNTVTAGSVTTNAGGTTRIGGSVTTTGGQTYDDNVEITSNLVTLSSTGAGSNIQFSGNLSANGSNRNLTVNTNGGTVTFQTVGSSGTPLQDLTVNSLTQLNGDVTTTGTQTYNGLVLAGGDRTLTANDLAFNSSVIGSGSLTLQPRAANRAIAINGPTGSNLNLTQAELNSLFGFTQVTIGQPTGTGAITVGGNGATTIFRTYDLVLQGSGSATFNDSLTLAAGRSLALNTNTVTNIPGGSGRISTSGGGAISIDSSSVGTAATPLRIDGVLGNVVISGASGQLHLTAPQILQQAGSTIQVLGANSIASFTSTSAPPNNASDVILSTASNNLNFTGTSTIGGNLTINMPSSSSISQAPLSSLQIAGTLTVTPGTNLNNLTSPTNIIPPIVSSFQTGGLTSYTVVASGDVNLSTILPTSNITGDLTVTVNSINQGFTGPAIIGAAGINLNQSNNLFNGSITLNTVSPSVVTPPPGGTIAPRISQSAAITVGGSATLTTNAAPLANNGVIDLSTPAIASLNQFGSLNLNSNTVGIMQSGNMTVSNATISHNIALSTANIGGITVNNANVGGNFTLSSVDGVALNNTTVAGNLQSTSSGQTSLSNLSVTGDLLVSSGGNITQTGIITQNSTTASATFNVGANSSITLDNSGNAISGITRFALNGGNGSLTNSVTTQLGSSALIPTTLAPNSNLTISSNSFAPFAPGSLVTSTNTSIRLQPINSNTNISLNYLPTSPFNLDVVALMNAVTNPDTNIIIGQNAGTGAVNIGGFSAGFPGKPLTVYGGSITTHGFISTSGGSLTFRANNGDIATQGIRTSGGNVDFQANNGDVQTQGINTTAFGLSNGGNVTLAGENVTVNGTIDPAAFGSGTTGTTTITATNGDVNLNSGILYFDVFGNSGNVQITATSQIALNNYLINGRVNQSASNAAGNASLIADTISLNNSGLLVDTAASAASGNGGTIQLNADDIALDGTIQVFNPFTFSSEDITISASSTGAAPSGNIIVNAANTLSLDGAVINNNIYGSGSGGTVSLSGSTVDLSNGSQINAQTFGSGNGGVVNVSATDTLSLEGAVINSNSSGSGSGGLIALSGNTVNLTNDLLNPAISTQLNANASNNGNGGSITVTGNALNIVGNTTISASNTGSGTGGSININTPNALTLQGITIDSQVTGSGNGGTIALSGNTTTLDGTQINTATSGTGSGSSVAITGNSVSITGGTQINATVQGNGNAGLVQLGNASTNNLQINNSTILAQVASGANGTGGQVLLQGNNILLDNQATINTNINSGGAGQGSNINLTGGTITLKNQSSVVAGTDASNTTSGNVAITAQNSLTLVDSQISTAATNAAANATAGKVSAVSQGDITLTNSQISTLATASNAIAGDVDLSAQNNIVVQKSQVLASSQLGLAGNIKISSTQLLLQNGILQAEIGQNTSGAVGSITLDITKQLTLEDESLISTIGLNGADGGNINILKVRFALASPATGPNGSDIVSQAFGGGRPGVILFQPILVQGFKNQRAVPGNRTNDIDGAVQSSTTGIDAIRVTAPPIVFVNLSEIVKSACEAVGAKNSSNGSQLSISGRGGVPSSPTALLSAQPAISDWVALELDPQVPVQAALPDGTTTTLEPGKIYQTQATCVSSWKAQQAERLSSPTP